MFYSLCYLLSQITIVFFMAPQIQSFRTHTALGSVVFSHMDEAYKERYVHNEYFFGKCATRDKERSMTFKYHFMELRGKLLVGDWLNIPLEPDCIYIRSRSYFMQDVKYDAQKFTFCVCHITYNYGGFMEVSYYYEWYIPLELTDGLEWEITFYHLL